MNERQPYEKHLADKLRQIPLPDPDKSWEQMSQLLDKEMPGSSAVSTRPRGWWWIGLVLILMFGTWFTAKQFLPANDVVAGKTITSNPQKKSESSDPAASSDAGRTNNASSPVDKDPSTSSAESKSLSNSSNDNIESVEASVSKVNSDKPGIAEKNVSSVATNPTFQPATFREENSTAKTRQSAGVSVNDLKSNRNANLVRAQPEKSVIDPAKNAIAGSLEDPTARTVNRAAVSTNIKTPDHIPYSSAAIIMSANSANTKSARKLNAAFKKSFAVGLSMPLGFPLGDQNPLGYNINARGNTLSDYLPAPHVQYHVNEKLYLQSEFQFQSPQFIQPVLLSQNKSISGSRQYTQAIYARKLYYFNLPIGIHYSPFRNFYLGTGLQFSSLLSGIAFFDERSRPMGWPSTDSIVSQRYVKFKNDTLSQKLNSTEIRLGLDANYFWDRFTVGLRYNQALSNYVSIRLMGSPLTQDKNKSLQFYLRYNLWDGRKPLRSLSSK